ncbi:MAG: helix-turn-helix domain-containing protein [Actinobacteria bacterium]|nr:MAG: helix-turn-helix domain-containing protein [Actinomycetota bacterium]
MSKRAVAGPGTTEEAEFAARVASGSVTFAFVDLDGKVVDPPPALYSAVRQAVDIVAEGDSPAVVALERDLTTQQAADIIGVSRPHLVSMLDHGALPYRRVGNRRRIPAAAVLEAKRRHDALVELTRLSQEYGLYDE